MAREYFDVLDVYGNSLGKISTRCQPLEQGEYHLVVHTWIRNSRGEFLLSQRTENKTYPLTWEATGGSALAGETSLEASLREVKEELGLDLDPRDGKRVLRTVNEAPARSRLVDVWLFDVDVDLEDIEFQETETCDAKWGTEDDIKSLLEEGNMASEIIGTYIEDFFAECFEMHEVI